MDSHFSFKEQRKEFKKFCRAFFLEVMKPYLKVLALLDAVITKAIDSSKFILKNVRDVYRHTGEIGLFLQELKHAPRRRDTKSESRIWKHGVTPQEIAIFSRALFPMAAVILQREGLDLFSPSADISQDALLAEFSIENFGCDEKRFKNQHKLCTYVA